MEWFFDGIGTEILKLLLGVLIGLGTGGIIGYKIGVSKKKISQKQKAGNDSVQNQIGEMHVDKKQK